MQTVTKKKCFWASKQDDLRKSKISNWVLCPRCKQLQRGDLNLEAWGPDSQMTAVFRQEVYKNRQKSSAVVVLCVDAINISGSLISTIRNYVGGNPILLAVTRCDLLPDYVWERHQTVTTQKHRHHDEDEQLQQDPGLLNALKDIFRQRAANISPAAVYLCSEDVEFRRQTTGIQELTTDLWKHLHGRDPYIIGAANIGKSTLTDILIAKLARKGEKEGGFYDRLAQTRLEALRRSRITKSSLPGTTLQNVRVPCFPGCAFERVGRASAGAPPEALRARSFSHLSATATAAVVLPRACIPVARVYVPYDTYVQSLAT